MSARYLVLPKADQDLEERAFYLATHSEPSVGHRFLVCAHETFSLLATQPRLGWLPNLNLPELKSLRVFRVSGFEKMLILYRPLPDGVEILRVIHGSRDVLALLRREGLR